MNNLLVVTTWVVAFLVAVTGCKQAVPDPEPATGGAAEPSSQETTAEEQGFAVDPEQRFRVPVPTNWETHELGGALVASIADKKIEIYFDSAEDTNVEELLAGAWATGVRSRTRLSVSTRLRQTNPGRRRWLSSTSGRSDLFCRRSGE